MTDGAVIKIIEAVYYLHFLLVVCNNHSCTPSPDISSLAIIASHLERPFGALDVDAAYM